MVAYELSVVQMRVGPDKADNLERAEHLVREAARGAELVVLPELFNTSYQVDDWPSVAEPVPDGPTCGWLSRLARSLGIHLAGGSVAELHEGRVYNTATLWGPDGQLLLAHRKVHLFDVDVPGELTFSESSFMAAGDSVSVVQTALGGIGLAVCFDVRFPELFRCMALRGAELVVLPAAFNTTTGPAHWEVTLRCRAVENGLYLAACSPAPDPEVDYPAWGHSMVVDPWATVLATTERDESVVRAVFERERLVQVRQALGLLRARRPEVYAEWGRVRTGTPG